MIPLGANPFLWAEKHLLASPGAIVRNSRTGQVFRVATLVPATKPDGSCENLTADGRCQIHAIAPFGCAFFDCGPEHSGLSVKGMLAVYDDHRTNGLYHRIWRHLFALGRVQAPPEALRRRMNEIHT